MFTLAFLLLDKAFKNISYFNSFKLRDIFEIIKDILVIVWLFIGAGLIWFIL